jgi:SH3-like domain-containing protein
MLDKARIEVGQNAGANVRLAMALAWVCGWCRSALRPAVVTGVCAVMVCIGASSSTQAQTQPSSGARVGQSGLPLPRFVSLKAQPVNMRKGPGTQFPIAWVMTFAGTPLEITREYGDWREVRDVDGTTGWILGSLLSGRRTAVVQPWDRRKTASGEISGPLVDLRASASQRSGVTARLEAGAIVNVKGCDTNWCAVAVSGFRGFVEQKRLWGVYPGERFR